MVGFSLSRGFHEKVESLFQVVVTSDVLEVLANFLVDCLAGGAEFFAGALD
jgi:hypothetical protein